MKYSSEGVRLFPNHHKDVCRIVPAKDEGQLKNAPHGME